MQENKAKLTPQQIKERRRQKILQRAAKQKKQQTEEPQIKEVKTQKQSKLLPQQNTKQKSKIHQTQQQQGQQNAFQRFNEMLRNQTRDVLNENIQKMMKLFSKIIGFVVAIVHVFFMYNLWTYHNKKLNKEINQAEFQFIKNKFQSENNVVFFTMLVIIYIIYYLIKSNKTSSSKTQKQNFQIIPGSTIVQILQKLNKVLGYKIFLQFLASYITAYIITVLLSGQILSIFGSSQWFYWNLNQIYSPLKANQDILL